MTVRTLAQVAAFLTVTPVSYNDLTAQQKQDFSDTLAPFNGFSGGQRAWFGDWWFACTQAQVDTMNAALPAKVRVQPARYLGVLYLNIDLATDCLNAGDTYAAARPVLRTLVCTNIPNLASLLPPPTLP
jgi:hypothetical protein